MQAIVKNDEKGASIECVSMEIPKPKPGFTLIKVHSSPVNPSDFGFMRGLYGDISLQPKPPIAIGFEGSGIITDVGEGVDHELIGKSVSFFSNCHSPDFTGCWANYTIQPVNILTIVPEKVDLEVASMAQVNPKTVMGFWHLISNEGHKSIVHTAAASALGKMLIKLCMTKGIETINIVRGPKNVGLLKALGASYVLDSEVADFDKNLIETLSKVNPTIFFDAVGGDLSGKIFNAMSYKSMMYIYGSLASAEILGLKGTDIRYKDKTIKGYHVVRLFESLTPEKRKEYVDFIWEDLQQGGKIFKTEVSSRYELKDFKEALEKYPKLASQGKIIFTPK